MALNTFGWTPSEVTTDSAGNVISGVTLTVFTDVTKANQVTGLFDKDGTTPLANNVVVSDNKGRFGFKASDTYSLLYVYDGSTSDPWPIAAHEALDQGMASHAQAVADAQAAADSAAQSAALVGAPADTAIATAINGSGTQTSAALKAAYAPRVSRPTRRALPAPAMVSAFQTGHGWTATGPGTWDLNHTADFALGSQSVKLVTDAATGNNVLTSPALTLDMTGKGLILWVKVVGDITKLAYVTIDAGPAGFASYFRGQPFNYGAMKEPLKAGEWLPLIVPWAELETTKVGTPSRASIGALRLNIAAQATALSVYVGGIATYTETTAYPSGVVSLTFDDSHASQFTMALPKMSTLGFAGSLFPIIGDLDQAGKLTTAQVATMVNVNGWGIGGHASTAARHVDPTTLSAATLAAELQTIRDWLDANGYPSLSYAYPVGPFNAAVEAATAKHFGWARSTIKHANTPLTPAPFRLSSIVASNAAGTRLTDAQAYVDQIVAGKSWGIVTFHNLTTGTAGQNEWTQADFNTFCDYLVTKGVAVRTVTQVMGA